MDIVPRQKALNFTPGAEYSVQQHGLHAARGDREARERQSLRDFADERIFKPLGMTSTHFHDDYTMLVPGRTSAIRIGRVPAAAGASAFRTSTSTARRVCSRPSATCSSGRRTSSSRSSATAAMFAQMEAGAVLVTGDTTEYGLGLRRTRAYHGVRVSESSGNDPGFQAYVGRYPDQHLAITVTCNAGSGANPTALGHGVADVFLKTAVAPGPALITQAGVALPRASLQSRVGVYPQPTTLAIVRLAVRDSSLVIAGPDARDLIPLAENRFAVAGEAGEIVFRDGVHAGYERRVPGQRPVFFEWHQAASPGAAVLAPYAGAFVSPELGGALYQVVATDSTLIVRTGTADALVARPAFADTFLAGGYTIQFTRANGRVIGFEVTNPRMRRVRFTRVP